MTTLPGQLAYFFKKTNWDMVTAVFWTRGIDSVFKFLQRKLTSDNALSIFNISDGMNAQIIRLLRMVFEPAFLLTAYNLNEISMFGDEADFSGGIYLTAVAISQLDDFFKQFNLFFTDLFDYLVHESESI